MIILKISKGEMMHLTKKGVPFGENGISHTIARGRRSYYLCLSEKNTKLHKEYQHSIKAN